MNDPCGAMYDPTRDMYHLFYQWHPEHINWGRTFLPLHLSQVSDTVRVTARFPSLAG